MVVLLVRLHLIGFLWGDVSLSNTLFRRDAGAFAAYLVDAETGELHDELTDGQREHDLHHRPHQPVRRVLSTWRPADCSTRRSTRSSLVEAIENRYARCGAS